MELLEKIAAEERPVNAYDDVVPVNDPLEFGGRGIVLGGVVISLVDDEEDKCLGCVSCRTGIGGNGTPVCWFDGGAVAVLLPSTRGDVN